MRKPSCAVPLCSTQNFNVEERYFFRFPKEHDRWLQWVQACGRLDLEPKGPEYAYQNCRLCHLHFEKKWYNINKTRARLHPDATPTIFFGPDFGQQKDNTTSKLKEMCSQEKQMETHVQSIAETHVQSIAETHVQSIAETQIQEENSNANTIETSVSMAISNIDADTAKPSTSTGEPTNKSSDDSPRKRKLHLKIAKLKAQNKTLRETIRRLRMEKKKKNTKVEEDNECKRLKTLGLFTCLKDE